MASGIYGRRVAEPTITDRTLFLDNQYPVTGANRALTNDLETVWDKVNDAKAVLQKLEHRMEISEDAKKAEDLAFTLPESALKKKPEATSQLSPVMTNGTPTKDLPTASKRTNRVAFEDPHTSFQKDFDPLHGSSIENLGSISKIHGNSASFIARDFRTNDFDLSRVSVRSRPAATKPDMSNSARRLPAEKAVDETSAIQGSGYNPDEAESPLKGKIISTKVLNELGDSNAESRFKPSRRGRDLRAAGVATTVTHVDPKQVYKHLQKEGAKKANDKRAVQPQSSGRSSLFHASPYAPHKRIDIVKERKKLEQNPEALSRLKEKIQRQKQRSPSSVGGSPGFKLPHAEEDPVIPMTTTYVQDGEKPRMRKIAHGPAAPKYKGFSTAETRVRTPDGKVWMEGATNHPYIPPRQLQGEKKPKAVTSLFKPSDTNKAKGPVTSGRLKPQSFAAPKANKSKNTKPVRKTGKICPDDPTHKKSLITPSSWREGQRVAESILGPPPKLPRKAAVSDKQPQRTNSPPTRDNDTETVSKKPLVKPTKKSDIGSAVTAVAAAASKPASAGVAPAVEESAEVEDIVPSQDEGATDGGSKSQTKKMSSSIKASIPKDKLSADVRSILDDLHLSSSESEDDDDRSRPLQKQEGKSRGRSTTPGKHSLAKDPKESKLEKIQKVRHYDQNKVQQYIAKQKAERKRKQSQERKAQREAQERKQKQLEELYRKQKEACAKKKALDMEGKGRHLKAVDLATLQALQKMDDILGQSDGKFPETEGSDKENSQRGHRPMANFDLKMDAFMEKLTRYDTSTAPKTHPASQTSEIRVPSAPVTNTASEFIQKLDRYLKDDTPTTAVSRVPDLTPPVPEPSPTAPTEPEPNLTVEELGALGETSPHRPGTVPAYRDKYGDPSGTYSPRYRQMLAAADSTSPRDEQVARQRSRAERIAKLKAQAESLQDRIETESRRLLDQPFVPIQPRLEEIDSILAQSGHGMSLPIQAWLPSLDTKKGDQSPHWQRSPRWDPVGTDVPDGSRSRGGLDDYSPSELPGVAGLRQHVAEVDETQKESEAASKIQSAYRGHAVRRAMDDWKLPSGQSMTDVRRQAASTSKVDETSAKDDDTDPSISEGPLSSRSEDSSKPMKLRSVEEILQEMKSKEYCVTDPSPSDKFKRTEWVEQDTDNGEPRTDRSGLSDLSSRIRFAKDDAPMFQADRDKPPWERTGGDKYSVVNVFTNKYLKVLKQKEKEEKEAKPLLEDLGRAEPSSERKITSAQSRHRPSEDKPKMSPRAEYSSNFENTEDETSEALSSMRREAFSTHLIRSPQQDSLKSPTAKDTRSHSGLSDDRISKSRDQVRPPAPTEVLLGRVSYTSSDEDKTISDTPRMKIDKKESPQNSILPSENAYRPDSYMESPPRLRTEGAPELSPRIELPKPIPVEKRFSPAALEQKMTAELNYQEAIEESLRHLTGVERTQGVSLAQQETVSLAQLMKARQLQHELEVERMAMKAKEEALAVEKMRNEQVAEEGKRRTEESAKMQMAARKTLETQAEAARSTAVAAKRLAYALDRDEGARKYASSAYSSDYSKSYTTSESVSPNQGDSPSRGSTSATYEPPGKEKGDKFGKKDKEQRGPPSMMSEHSTTSVRPSDNDTQSSIPEMVPSTEEDDEKKKFKKLDLDRSSASDASTAKSITEEIVGKQADNTDKSISEEIEMPSEHSSVKRAEKPVAKKKIAKNAKTNKDQGSDSSDMSVCFDESLTEDEIAEISRRVVVPSESYRRHQRRRSPHAGALDRSDVSSDDQPSSARQKTPRGTSKVSLDDFTIGPALAGAADSEFAHFMDQMVRQYMKEEEVRAKHQAAMLKLRERAIKEKSETELSWLDQLKKQVRNKGEDDKMPPIKKKQRAILLRLKLETEEIKKLRAVTKAASHERKLFLQQHKESAARRAKLKAAEDKLDVETGLAKAKGKPDEAKDPHVKSSTPIPNTNLPEPPDVDDVSESNSELDLSSASSIFLKNLKKQSAFDQRKLTKREQRLMQRKKQAEQLIAWKKRLDQEEKKVYHIEKQALSAWEKERDSKAEKVRPSSSGESPRKQGKERETSDSKLTLKEDSSHEESSSAKSPESEHHSSPPPPSHSESSIAEELVQSGTNSTRSVISPVQDAVTPRNQEESSDGTNADDYTQSFESVTSPHRSPRSPRATKEKKQEKPSTSEAAAAAKKDMKKEPTRPNESDLTPSSTPLLPTHSKSDKPTTTAPTKAAPGEKAPLRRRESAESWSDESFSQTQSETEQSDIECRVRALKEELKRRRFVAERLKKEQKKRHKDRLKAQEASLRSQIEAYDVFIKKTQNELAQELDNQLNASAPASTSHLPVAKPQIRSPRKSDQAKQAARAIRSTAASVVSPEASPRSGSHRTPAAVSLLGKNRTESESSGKSSRSLSFDDDEKTGDDATPNGSTKSFTVGGVAQTSPLPSKHQDKLPPHSHHDTASSGASTPAEKKTLDRPKRLDLTDAAATLLKLTKPPSPNGFTPTAASPVSSTASEKQKSHIPVASKTPPSTASVITPPRVSPPIQQTKKSLIPVPVSTSESSAASPKPKVVQEKTAVSSPSPLPSEKSLTYSEDFESSAASKKNAESQEPSIATDDDISEHFSDVSTGTSGGKSDHSGALLDLSTRPKALELPELNKDDTLHGVEDLGEMAEKKAADEEDEEKTPVASPAQTPVPSSPRTPTPDSKRDRGFTGDRPFEIGDRVLLAGREPGVVRFVGETKFAPGMWIGAELQHPAGKNDGMVNDVRYFTCSPKFGIFAPLSRVELLSPRSQSTASARSSLSHFEYDEEADKTPPEVDAKSVTDSEASAAGSDAAKPESTLTESAEGPASPPEKAAKLSSPVKTGLDRNRLADELSDKLLTSLLQDSVSNILDSHTKKRQSEDEGEDEDVKRRKLKEENVEKVSSGSSDEEDVALSASTRNLLEMLATSPDQMEGDMVYDEDEDEVRAKAHESLADTFTGDLLADTLTKVLEIRRQRAMKWKAMDKGDKDVKDGDVVDEEFKPRDVDNGREVEDILLQEAISLKKMGTIVEPGGETDRENVTPARPVSPIFGASQDDVLEEWFDEDFGISAFHKKKPLISKDEEEGSKEEEDVWQDGRLIEVLSSRIEPPPPPPKFVIPHKPEHILRLVEDAVAFFYTKHLRGDLKGDVRIPDFLYQDRPGEVSDDEDKKDSDESDEDKKEAATNADHVFKTSLFDMVKELITEIYSSKSTRDEATKRPLWLKKKSVTRPPYCRRIPKTADELLQVVSKQVCKLLNLHGDALKLDPKVTMKWGTRKKKDKVDIILIQELREEEPEWTNYDEDETTVKMQLTDTVLDMLLSDTVRCLDDIDQKREQRRPMVVPTATEDNSQSNDERSQ